MDTSSNQSMMEKCAFVSWGTNTPPAGNFTGVITYRRDDGSRIAEREFFNGYTWGTTRYFNSNDRFVGQELYGKLGYDPNNPRDRIGGGVVCHQAWSKQPEFTRIRGEYNGNYKAYYKVFCKFTNMRRGYSGKTGLDTCLRTNGTAITEREWGDGTAWGCHRYYDEQKKLVGQTYHGGFHFGGPGKRPIDTDLDPFLPIPRGPSLSRYNEKKEFEHYKAEYYSSRVPTLVDHIFAGNQVRSNDDFVNLLCNIDDIAVQTSKSMEVGQVPDDVDMQCNLVFFVLREHPAQWSTNQNIADALQCEANSQRKQQQQAVSSKKLANKNTRTVLPDGGVKFTIFSPEGTVEHERIVHQRPQSARLNEVEKFQKEQQNTIDKLCKDMAELKAFNADMEQQLREEKRRGRKYEKLIDQIKCENAELKKNASLGERKLDNQVKRSFFTSITKKRKS